MDGLEEEFSPEKWTQKELVKHLYREVSIMSSKIDTLDSKLETRYSAIEVQYRQEFKEIDSRLDKIEQFRASTSTTLKVIGAIGTAALGGVVTILVKMFELI